MGSIWKITLLQKLSDFYFFFKKKNQNISIKFAKPSTFKGLFKTEVAIYLLQINILLQNKLCFPVFIMASGPILWEQLSGIAKAMDDKITYSYIPAANTNQASRLLLKVGWQLQLEQPKVKAIFWQRWAASVCYICIYIWVYTDPPSSVWEHGFTPSNSNHHAHNPQEQDLSAVVS